MITDQNIIQIRDAFMLAKRQYELTPELLADIETRRLFHALINISTPALFDGWLAEMRHSAFHYMRPDKDVYGVYGNVLGEVERIALELTPEQRAAAAAEFSRLGTVDMRVIDYATTKYNHIFAIGSDYAGDLKGIRLRRDTAKLLTADDVDVFNAMLDAVKDAALPPEIRDYVDFARTFSDDERVVLLLNNTFYGEESSSQEITVNSLRDTFGYCTGVISDVISSCGQDLMLSVTPRRLAFRLPSSGDAYEDEHHVSLVLAEYGKADAWLSTGRHYDLHALIHKEEDDCDEDAKAVLYCVADYLDTHRYVLKPAPDGTEEDSNPVYGKYADVKRSHPHDVVLLRQDGYYEAFGDDAVICAGSVPVPLWFRSTGYGYRTAAVVFPEETLAVLRKRCHRVFVAGHIREPDDENLGLSPCFLNLLRDCDADAVDASVIVMADRDLAVRGNYGHSHFPPKKLSKEEAFYFRCINGKAEREAAVKAFLLKKNLKEINSEYGLKA